MKKALILALAAGLVGSAFAQSNFTIVKPSEGARVRETVRLLFPKTSVSTGPEKDKYVSIYLNGKFLEAVVPGIGANYAYYDLDTKARGIPDGPLAIEAVLYQDFADRPRIIDRSSINVTVGNSASINIPAGGLDLAYKYRAGTSWIYTIRQRTAVNDLSETNAGNASVESLLAGADEERIRIQYSIDNTYPGGESLMRIQALPAKGKTDAIFTLSNDPTPKRFEDHEMAPIYMRLNRKGTEQWGSIPRYFPLDGTAGEVYVSDLYAAIPLPTLPNQKIRPDSAVTTKWLGYFQLGSLDLEKAAEATSVTTKKAIPAQGEFMGVEWEGGHPCAVYRHSLGTRNAETGAALAASDSQIVNATSIQETVFFALDLGAVTKVDRVYTIDVKQTTQRGGGGGAGGNGAPSGGPAGFSGAGGAPSSGSNGGPGRAGSNVNRPDNGVPRFSWNMSFQGEDEFDRRGGRGMARPGGGQGPRPGGMSGAGSTPGGGRSGGAGTQTRILRVTVSMQMLLEK